MTNKQAIEVLKKLKKGINLMNAFVGEEDKDLIDIEALDFAIKALEVRPQGEWKHNSDHPDNLICSVCNCEWDMWRYESKELKFCPNCGADMRGGGE